MADTERRIALGEPDGMEGGIRCPSCGRFATFVDIMATGGCGGGGSTDCDASLRLDLVLENPDSGG